MIFSKLRVLGFKSFVEPAEFIIESGLTGVVGPNGCGKSNLVEALRWVMGENSYKNMRAAGMDEVIFSGSSNRPSRNTAEVTLFLDNSDRSAPIAFNDADELQVSRRIERESGSVYRINGKDVRAKDVQLLFADASTGARSPSMVGQGRIGELISAKPQARRALLEEAAGISGLHSRRHEAELRLKGAETNLERLEDVVVQLTSQLDGLKRQARQANRYRSISDDIRKTEALLFYLRWSAAKKAESVAESHHNQSVAQVAEAAQIQAKTAKDQAVIAHGLPPLRENEAKAAAALQRLAIARNQIDDEIARIARRKVELEHRIGQLAEDLKREEKSVSDHDEMLDRLNAEEGELLAQSRDTQSAEQKLKEDLKTAADILGKSENEFSELTAQLAGENANRQQLSSKHGELILRNERLDTQIHKFTAQLNEIKEEIAKLSGPEAAKLAVDELEIETSQAQKLAIDAENYAREAHGAEQNARDPLTEARYEVNRIDTEARTISKFLNNSGQDLFPAIIEQISVEPGFEIALGATLGEGLDISTNNSAPAYWSLIEPGNGDPAIPSPLTPLSQVVKAPAELERRLSQIAVVDSDKGAELSKHLRCGQMLVSKKGEIWRWDGYVAGTDAPTMAAQKLEQKNRLESLDRDAILAKKKLNECEGRHNNLKTQAEIARISERETRDNWRKFQAQLQEAQEKLNIAERAVGQFATRRALIEENLERNQHELIECQKLLLEVQNELEQLEPLDEQQSKLDQQKIIVAQDRASLAQARAASDGLSIEAEARGRRLQSIISEREGWNSRREGAQKQIGELVKRSEKGRTELNEIELAPDDVEQRRAGLANQIEDAEQTRKQASDQLAITENSLAKADENAKNALMALSRVREETGRAEERATAATTRKNDIETRIKDELECQPHETRSIAEFDDEKPAPEASTIERKLEKIKSERERLGAVNLRADIEQVEINEQRDGLTQERDDLIEAIKRLRQAISSLNSQGREKLLVAFDQVNEEFQRLFTHLFGGGTAQLQLIESDDPLEAGLEILARPPGKKPQTMTLLSGGEQALTAMALIFAVFLTNPAPICVLDEVDAPLDDHNVERFCNLMDEMSQSTRTRFVIITHNPITMARMNRLFGVTMAERGVSQLVSVDLQTAEQLREAG